MISKAAFFLVSSLQLTMYLANAANLRSTERDLYGYDDATDDAAVETDDATATNTTSAYNGTVTDHVKDYTITHVQSNYQSIPSEWSGEQWGTFAALMFVFGSIASCFCLFFVFPFCCPTVMTTAYARFLNPPQEDTKKVKLIRK
mmetsp:Transcript_5710/g.8650  ORF Transcript_5710/g.8650 Transcript_5710/m.8650 type:complete len:145 (+) Transcript_5710:29-463(+)